jgi:2'-5' RNA ligase
MMFLAATANEFRGLPYIYPAGILPDCGALLDPQLIADTISYKMNTPSDPIRLFFALWPDELVRRSLSGWPLHCGGRTMSSSTLHATLVFLGEIDAMRLETLKLAAEEVVAAEFDLCIDVARYWGHNHILYAAPRIVPDRLLSLVSELEQHLTRHHFVFDNPHPNLPPEVEGSIVHSQLGLKSDVGKGILTSGLVNPLREYKPHVTLMRNVRWNDTPLPEMPPVYWRVDEFVLLQSVPGDSEAHYQILANFRLAE